LRANVADPHYAAGVDAAVPDRTGEIALEKSRTRLGLKVHG
jgi:hypothetical protein